MPVCSNCGKAIRDDSVFCQYCGEKVIALAEAPSMEEEAAASELSVKKRVPKKTFVRCVIGLILVAMIASVVVCETNIAKARRLYAQDEYFKAFSQIEHIPTLGREEFVRMKIGWVYGGDYHSYLTTKRIRLSSTSSRSRDAYQSAFWELTFGYYICVRDVNNPESRLNEIQRDEGRKFVERYSSELSSMFHMSRDEANKLAALYQELDGINEKKAAANDWLDRHFF